MLPKDSQPPLVPPSETPASQDDGAVLRDCQRGLALLAEGCLEEGLAELERAYEARGGNPDCQSGYALGLALVRGRFPEAVTLAEQAVRGDYENPELYLNLAKIHLASGSRAMAFQTLARGLRIAPDHEGLSAARAALGLRQRPWLRFLPRSHILNRSLGAVRARLARTSPDSV